MNPCQVTQGFALRSIRERAKSLRLLACNWVQEQRILGHTKKRIIRGVCLGSSVLNTVHWPLLYRWERYRVIGAVPSAVLKYTALITQSNDCASARSGEGSSTPSTSALCTEQEHPFPPSASRETCCDVPVRPQLLSSAVFSCLLHRRVIRTHETFAIATPSRVWV